MRILVINPNSDEETEKVLNRKAEFFRSQKLIIYTTSLKKTPKLMVSKLHWAQALPEMVDIVSKSEYDGFVIACHADPNLDVLKEISNKPVVGIAEASMKIASMVGNGFAIITPSLKIVTNKRALARKYFCEDLYVTTEVPGNNTYEEVLASCVRASKVKGVDSIILGCANYAEYDTSIEEELGITILDGLSCALAIIPGLAHYQNHKRKGVTNA